MAEVGGAHAEPTGIPSADALAVARRIYRARGAREGILGHGLFTEPAWDMLLDLLICQGERRLSVSAACLGARVPHATGVRYLALLFERGLVERLPDPSDGRRTYVRLTRRGLDAMEACLLRFA